MANSAFDHSPTITVPGSSTDTALVRWSGTGGKTFLDSTILVGATTMGLAADTDLLTFGNGTIAITGAITGVTTITATTFSGALSGNASGSAATLTNARTIGGTSFNGSANIVPATITVADTTDTSSYVGLWESATGDLAPKTDAALTYNAGTGALTATEFHGGGGNLTGISAGAALSGSTNNTVVTVTGANAMIGEANLTFDGTDLSIANGGKIYIDGGGDTYIIESSANNMSFYTGGTERIKIASGGQVTMPTQTAFMARLTTAQNNVTGNTILFRSDSWADNQWTIYENRGSGFEDGKFTAPVSGLYQFNIQINLAGLTSSHNYFNAIFYSDGPAGNISMTNENPWAQNYSYIFQINWSMLIELAADDYAYFGGYVYNGQQVVDVKTSTYFSGFLVA